MPYATAVPAVDQVGSVELFPPGIDADGFITFRLLFSSSRTCITPTAKSWGTPQIQRNRLRGLLSPRIGRNPPLDDEVASKHSPKPVDMLLAWLRVSNACYAPTRETGYLLTGILLFGLAQTERDA